MGTRIRESPLNFNINWQKMIIKCFEGLNNARIADAVHCPVNIFTHVFVFLFVR